VSCFHFANVWKGPPGGEGGGEQSLLGEGKGKSSTITKIVAYHPSTGRGTESLSTGQPTKECVVVISRGEGPDKPRSAGGPRPKRRGGRGEKVLSPNWEGDTAAPLLHPLRRAPFQVRDARREKLTLFSCGRRGKTFLTGGRKRF